MAYALVEVLAEGEGDLVGPERASGFRSGHNIRGPSLDGFRS